MGMKLKRLAMAVTMVFSVAATGEILASDSPVSGRIGSLAMTERGLAAAAEGNFDEADQSLEAAFKADPADPRPAEALVALRSSRGDIEGSARPARALLSSGNPRQAIAAAEVLSKLGYDALDEIRTRQDAYSSVVSAEWIASRQSSLGRWEDAARATSLGLSDHPSSWRLSTVRAVAMGMLDSPAEAEKALEAAKMSGAPEDALASAARVVSAAKERAAMGVPPVARSTPSFPDPDAAGRSSRMENPAASVPPPPNRAIVPSGMDVPRPYDPALAPLSAQARPDARGPAPAREQADRFRSGRSVETAAGDDLF